MGRARPGEVCVPGASFFFGNPQFRGRSANEIADERLVVLSPFFIDISEVTVGAFRSTWPALSAKAAIEPVTKVSDPFCTWSATPVPADEVRALNCVNWPTANTYCKELGKELPTEAQIELVMSGLGEEWAFPWGNDEPDCSGAVWGCGGIESATLEAIRRGANNCRLDRRQPGPFPPGQGLSDKIGSSVLRNAGGDDVLDLGGNLSEWTRDAWARPQDPFWRELKPQVDPINVVPNAEDGDAHTVRGGDWAETALLLRAGVRRRRTAIDTSPLLGLRCVRVDRAE